MGETPQRMPAVITIRPMTLSDIDAVLAVELLSFITPWSRDAFVAEAGDNDLAVYLVLEGDGQVIGYAGMWVILDEAHVTNVAVLPACRGQGLGERLMRALIDKARGRGACRMTLEVRPSNTAALGLYGKLGFAPCGLRPRYYSETGEDAVIMWLDKL